MEARRRLPGWLVTAGWVVLGVSALGLPTALVAAFLDAVRREGSALAQGLLLGGLVLLAVVLVVAAERGVAWAAREGALSGALWGIGGLVALVLLGVFVPPAGLVLLAIGVVLGVPAAVAGTGFLAWWRWQHGPRPARRSPPSVVAVRARAEERRVAVRLRRTATRRAVEDGWIGPGFTRGRGPG